MTHYPNIIRRVGPLIHSSAMRFEAKHRYFTKLSSSINNFINICKTFSSRHQQMMFQTWNNLNFEQSFETGKLSEYELEKDEKIKLNIKSDDKIYSVNFIDFKQGYKYRLDYFIYIEKIDSSYKFGLINNIFFCNNEIYFDCIRYSTGLLNEVVNSYNIINNNNEKCIIKYTDLKIRRPFENYLIGEINYILLPIVLL